MRTLALLLTILAVPAQAASFCGNMVMPAGALGSISRGFTGYHSGIDLAAPLGSTIRSAAAGTVTYAGWYKGYGNMVDIQHADGLVTRYAHMSSYVPELGYGTPVKAGQIVGLVGKTGHATGNHIHFEVRGRELVIKPELPMSAYRGILKGYDLGDIEPEKEPDRTFE